MTRTDLARLSDINAGAGLEFTSVAPLEVVLNSSTAASISRTLSPAIAGVPSDAALATGYILIHSTVAATVNNLLRVFHDNSDNVAAIVYDILAAGLYNTVPFACKVHQSSGSKIYYEVVRASGTVSYQVVVTGYWAPASV